MITPIPVASRIKPQPATIQRGSRGMNTQVSSSTSWSSARQPEHDDVDVARHVLEVRQRGEGREEADRDAQDRQREPVADHQTSLNCSNGWRQSAQW